MNISTIHQALKPISWLEGTWRVESVASGVYPTIKPFKYCEELTFASIGQPMFNYTAQSWHAEKGNPMHRESGFFKIIPDTNKVSLILAHNFGLSTIEEGEVSDKIINLMSTSISRPTKGTKQPAVLQIKREWKLMDDKLHHILHMATETTPNLTEHLYAIYNKIS